MAGRSLTVPDQITVPYCYVRVEELAIDVSLKLEKYFKKCMLTNYRVKLFLIFYILGSLTMSDEINLPYYSVQVKELDLDFSLTFENI
jgi:hypothetical protein